MIIAVSLIVLVGLVVAYVRRNGNSYDVDKLVSGITNQVKALEEAAAYHRNLYDTYAGKVMVAQGNANRATKIANKMKDLVN